jgi:hypothetical protein
VTEDLDLAETSCTTCFGIDEAAVLHPVYLPFPAALLRQHFAPVAQAHCHHAHYYLDSVARTRAHEAECGLRQGLGRSRQCRWGTRSRRTSGSGSSRPCSPPSTPTTGRTP